MIAIWFESSKNKKEMKIITQNFITQLIKLKNYDNMNMDDFNINNNSKMIEKIRDILNDKVLP